MSIERQIAFSQIKGLQADTACEILERVGGVDGFFDSSTRLLWDKIGSQRGFCSDAARDSLLAVGGAEKEFCASKNINPIFLEHDAYPTRLRECNDAPLMLYKLGACDLNARHVVSIVGTRRATPYGQRFTSELVAGLADQLDSLVIVSGLAYGIDVAAHLAALQAGVPTVGVLAHGLTTIYPADHRDIAARMVKSNGALVTEYISTAPIHRGNFLARNRIVAGMSDVTVIVESEEKGGSMVTAAIAFAYNREVCTVPARVSDRYSQGPLKLLVTNRASVIRNADDLINLLNWERKPSAVKAPQLIPAKTIESLPNDQRRIAEFLRSHHTAKINDMVTALGIPYSTLSARLMEMEMDDLIIALPGASYSLNI